jgi:oligopeptide transport system substrate-binding protein
MTTSRLVGAAMVCAGASLLAGGLASARSDRDGGIFSVGVAGPSVSIDPQVSYVTTGWWLEYATAAKLFNYPDKAGQAGGRLVPEVASRSTVSNDGRTYTFAIRKGFHFSDGAAVTAKSFVYAIDRAANHDLGSPAAAFITDPSGTDIVGAAAASAGRASHVSGVSARGNRLVIRLVRPDTSLVSTLALPFFQATSRKLPLGREVASVADLRTMPTAGPYAFSLHVPNVGTELRRNPYWNSRVGRRPRHLAGVSVEWNLNEEAAFQRVENNDLDEGPLPPAHVHEVATRFGVNKSRFWVKASSCIGYLAFNNARGIFAGNPSLRKAVNWALDRRDYANAGLPFSRSPWTHILSPTTPGSVRQSAKQPYSVRSNFVKARALARGHFRDARIVIGYRLTGTARPVDLVQRDLIQMGFDRAKIVLRFYPGAQIYDAIGRRGSDIDLAVGAGVCLDLPDPLNQLRLFVSAQGPGSVRSEKYLQKLAAASRLSGSARLQALGKLDIEIMKNLAPIAAMHTYNNRFFVSARVQPRSLVYQPVYQDWSIPALELK